MKLVIAILLAATAGGAKAQVSPTPGLAPPPTPPPALAQPPLTAPSGATTTRGPGLLSAGAGSTQSIMIPGSPVPGTVFDNGNGSSTMMVPGSVPQVIITPR
jgi:hypothetical protein